MDGLRDHMDHVDRHGRRQLVLRPAAGNMIQRQAILLWVLTSLLGVIAAGVSVQQGATDVAAFIVALVLAGIGLTWVTLRSKRIVVTTDEIAQLGLFIRRRGQRVRARRLVRAQVIQPRALIYDTVFVLDGMGKPVIRIYGHVYEPADIDRLVEFLGLPCEGPDRPVTAPDLDAMHPGIVPWHQARPVQFGFVGAFAAVAFAVVLTIVLQIVLT